MTATYPFSPAEQKTRRHWLITTFLYIATFPVLCLLFSNVPFATKAASTVISLVGLYILYHCAYKKHGTRYLTLCLVLGPITMLSNTAFELAQTSNPLSLLTIFTDLAIYIWWYTLNLKLRALNARIRSFRLSTDCPFSTLHQAQTLEDLDTQFTALIKGWPQHEPLISHEYQKKKQTLNGPI